MFHTRKNIRTFFSAAILCLLMCSTQILPASAAVSASGTANTYSEETTDPSSSDEESGETPSEDEELLKIAACSEDGPDIPDSAVFTVTDANGKTVVTKKYSEFKEDGYFILKKSDNLVEPGQTYTVTETNAAISGYSLDISYEIEYEEPLYTILESTQTNSVFIESGNLATVTIYNTYTKFASLKLKIKSIGEVSTPGSALLTIKNTDSGKVVAQVDYDTIKMTGSYTISNLTPGDYTVTETGADVSGYDRWKESSTEYISLDDGDSYTCTITNRYEKKVSAKCKKWLNNCKKVGTKLVKKKFRYNNNNTSPTLAKAVKKKKLRVCNCSLYTSWCLQQQKAIKKGYRFYTTGSGSIKKSFKKWGKKVQIIKVKKKCSKVNLRPGDIVCFSSHSAIYAGKGLWYDGGKSATKTGKTNSVYKNVGPKEESYLYNRKVSYIIRVKGL